MCRIFNVMTYGSCRTFSIIEELVFPFFILKTKTLNIMSYLERDCKALSTISIQTTTQTWMKHLQPMRFSGSWKRFK
jgi:hypothetical protein